MEWEDGGFRLLQVAELPFFPSFLNPPMHRQHARTCDIKVNISQCVGSLRPDYCETLPHNKCYSAHSHCCFYCNNGFELVCSQSASPYNRDCMTTDILVCLQLQSFQDCHFFKYDKIFFCLKDYHKHLLKMRKVHEHETGSKNECCRSNKDILLHSFCLVLVAVSVRVLFITSLLVEF